MSYEWRTEIRQRLSTIEEQLSILLELSVKNIENDPTFAKRKDTISTDVLGPNELSEGDLPLRSKKINITDKIGNGEEN